MLEQYSRIGGPNLRIFMVPHLGTHAQFLVKNLIQLHRKFEWQKLWIGVHWLKLMLSSVFHRKQAIHYLLTPQIFKQKKSSKQVPHALESKTIALSIHDFLEIIAVTRAFGG